MEEKEKSPAEETASEKSSWQATKEGWYDKIPLTVKQLDLIIGLCIGALVVVFALIFLESAGIFSLFG